MDTVKILVVEDDVAARMDIQAAVERGGYGIAGVASSGAEGIRLADALNPNLVLMSIRTEGAMDGVAVADEIFRRLDIPVVFITAHAESEILRHVGTAGPYSHVLKPVDHRELKFAIEMGLYKHAMERDLQKARQAAEAADRAKTSFLATISHELRTPMNGVLGMTELLLLSDLEEPYRENVVLIKDSALSLLSVLNQIIDYSKLETSSMKLREMDFRLEDLLTGVLSQYKRTASAKGVKVGYTFDPVVPEWLRGDSGKIRQALGNLINNAVKFTPSGQVMVDVLPTPIGESVPKDGGLSIQVLVQDTGVGMSSEQMDIIFESFCQVEDHLCHRTGGLGLGLAIVNRLLTILGGSVQCTSEEGRGSTFSLIIPLKRSRYEIHSPLTAVMGGEKPLQGARVLVAEDDLINQRYIVRLLEKMGCTAALVEEGQRAVDILKAEPFDIVLMDIEMPVMNGIEATRAIRRQETGCLDPNIPIVALTAHAMWGDEQRCMHAGMTDYVPKPVDMETVAAIIQSTLAAR